MPNTINIRKCIRREPSTREDFFLKKLRALGVIKGKEKKVYQLPKAPGVFSLGPDCEPVQVPNDEVVQPVAPTGLDASNLSCLKDSMKNLF